MFIESLDFTRFADPLLCLIRDSDNLDKESACVLNPLDCFQGLLMHYYPKEKRGLVMCSCKILMGK